MHHSDRTHQIVLICLLPTSLSLSGVKIQTGFGDGVCLKGHVDGTFLLFFLFLFAYTMNRRKIKTPPEDINQKKKKIPDCSLCYCNTAEISGY